MTRTFKKISAVVLSAGLLTVAFSSTLPWVSADNTIPDPSNWQYSMVQDFSTLTNSNDGGTDRDYWQSTGNTHEVQWKIADAKGVDASNALYVHTTLGASDNHTAELSINRTNTVAGACGSLNFQAIDVTSPTELWVWVDFTGTTTPERFRIVPNMTVDGNSVTLTPKDTAPIYFQAGAGWKASAFKSYTDGTTYADLNHVFVSEADLAGFKGYIRMPLSSFDATVGGTATTIDWATAHVTAINATGSAGTALQTAFYYNYDASKNLIDDGFYLDNILVAGTTAVGNAKVSDLLPKANASLKYAMVQDFNASTNANDGGTDVDYWQSTGNTHKVQWVINDTKGADSSKGLYVHTALGGSDNGKNELSINRTNYVAGACTAMNFNSIDVTSPAEVWLWVDFTGTTNPERFRFTPSFTVDGNTVACSPKKDAPIYFQTATGWKQSSFVLYSGSADADLNHVFVSEADLAGFKGYIRMPLTSFITSVNGSDGTVDWSTAHITAINSTNKDTGLQTAFLYQYDASGKLIDDGFYLDNILVTGATAASDATDLNVPDVSLVEAPATTTTEETTTSEVTTTTTVAPVVTIPDASSYKAGMVEDFESLAAGSSYANWGNYYNLVADEAKDGVGAGNSRGLYIHTTTAAGGYTQPFYYMNKAADFSGATELWIWLDFSNYQQPNNMKIRPRMIVNGSQEDPTMIGSAPVYFQTANGWRASTLTDAPAATPTDECALRSEDLTGFKGYVRIPLTDFRGASGNPISGNISNFTGGYWLFNFTGETDDNENTVENGYVMDNIALVGPNMNSSLAVSDLLSSTAPTTTTVESTTTTAAPTTTTVESTTTTAAPTTTTVGSTTTTAAPTTTTVAPTTTTAAPTTSTSKTAATTTAAPVATTTSESAVATTSADTAASTTATTENANPQTGENSPIAAVGAFVILAAASGALLVFKKRK